METAKVDIRKLQLLNDRIAQCAEALNQVRLSVHGLTYGAGYGQAGVSGLMQNPAFAVGQTGLSHTSPTNPYGFVPQFSPIPQIPQIPQMPQVSPIPGWNPYGGLSHTGLDVAPQAWGDPYLAQRLAQTFPFAFAPFGFPQVTSL